MTGTIVNRYNCQITPVVLTKAVSVADGRVHLVNKREFEGGKHYLNTFDPTRLLQTSEMVLRDSLKQVEPSPHAA